MAETSEERPSHRSVVRPLSRATGRPCSRPGCPSPSRATLTFSYGSQEVWLEPLHDEPPPHAYDLCPAHADRTQPPRGWTLVDGRPETEGPGGPRELGGERTVAVIAAALHGRTPLPDDDGDDPLREALEELQAVELPEAEASGRDVADDLRLVDRETRRRRRAAAMEALDGDGIRSTVEQARRAAGDLVRDPRPKDPAPGRQVPAAGGRSDDAEPDDEGPATLW